MIKKYNHWIRYFVTTLVRPIKVCFYKHKINFAISLVLERFNVDGLNLTQLKLSSKSELNINCFKSPLIRGNCHVILALLILQCKPTKTTTPV